jgi:hypothetical protein
MTVISLALLSAACGSPDPQSANRYNTGPTPSGYIYASSEQACADYGFVSGSASFERCVSRERAARSAGRMTQTYEQSRLTIDAQNACASYGLDAGSSRYDRCVGREIDARGWRAEAVVSAPMYRTDRYGYRIDSEGYRVDADGYRIDSEGRRLVRQAAYAPQPQPYYTPQPQPQVQAYVETRPIGQQVTRDEFGFRYDAYGNRLDARGNVISPQSTIR